MTRVCPNCKAENDEDSIYCSECGKKIINDSQVEDKSISKKNMDDKNITNSSKRNKIIISILVIIACISCVLAASSLLNIDVGLSGPQKEYYNINITGTNNGGSNGEIMYYLYYYDEEDDAYKKPSLGGLWKDWYDDWPPYNYISPGEKWNFDKYAKTGYDQYKLKIEWYEGDELYPSDSSELTFKNSNYTDLNFYVEITNGNDVLISQM